MEPAFTQNGQFLASQFLAKMTYIPLVWQPVWQRVGRVWCAAGWVAQKTKAQNPVRPGF